MNTKYLLFNFLIFLQINIRAQNCANDSIVTVYCYDQNYANYFTNYIRTDTFNTTTGYCNSCVRIGRDSLLSQPVCQQHLFSRRFLSLNNNHDTVQYVLLDGTGTGFVNRTKIDFTYDTVTNRVLSRLEYSGNGSVWNLSRQETWTYNASHELLNYTRLANYSGSMLENEEQHIYNYNNVLLSVVYQVGPGSNWTNTDKYSYTYNINGKKDSVKIQKWDPFTTTWNDSLQLWFNPANGNLANYSTASYDTTGVLTDSLLISMDSLNNTLYSYSSGGGAGNTDDNYSQNQYAYVGNLYLKNINSYVDDNGCMNYGSSSYDANGVFVGSHGGSHCAMPTDNMSSRMYDGNYRLLNCHYEYHSNVNDVYRDSTFYYSNYNTINFSYIPLENFNMYFCQGDTIRPGAILSGGCGSYHFHWTPSTGLSSDTVMEPFILIHDSITYTITVSDTTGHTASTTFTVKPDFIAHITYASPACGGCPIVLHTNQGWNYTYQWYRDNLAIPGANIDSLIADSTGSYFVVVNSTYPTCTSQSEIVSTSLYLFIQKGIHNINSSIIIYPNPAHDYLIFRGVRENSEIRLNDITGNTVKRFNIKNDSGSLCKISVNDLKTALYFITVTDISGMIFNAKVFVFHE